MSLEPGGVLSQYVYAVMYAVNVFSLLFAAGAGVGAGVGCGCVVVAGTGVGLGVGLFFTGFVGFLGVVVASADGASGKPRASLCQRQLAAVISPEATPWVWSTNCVESAPVNTAPKNIALERTRVLIGIQKAYQKFTICSWG
jgi:hypothetical protein